MLSSLPYLRPNAAHVVTSFNSNAKRRPKYVLMLLLPFFAILAQAPFVAVRGQTFGTEMKVSPSTICKSADSSAIVLITKVTGTPPGTTFTALLSDQNGEFNTITAIGTADTTDIVDDTLTINANIPGGFQPSAGYKILILSSNNFISKIKDFAIKDQTGPTVMATSTDVSSCGGGSDGTITGTANGGLTPYAWSGRRLNPLTFVPVEANGEVDNLAPGTYEIFATDNNGCRSASSATLIQQLPPTIEVSTLGNVSSCGSVDGDDGNGFFTLRVSPRTDTSATGIRPFTFTLTPDLGVFESVASAPFKFADLPQDTYSVTMTDGAGCVSNTITNIVIGKDSPLAISLSGWGNPTTCGGTNGDITVLNTGGSHSTYRYRISADDGATWSDEQSGRRFGGLGAGTYTIEGRDSRGCTATLVKTLTDPKGCTLAAAGSTDALSVTALNALKLQVFPNPTRTSFTLSLQSSSKESVQIIVTDMVGKKLYQTTGSGSRQYTFGSEFSSGMYIVEVIQGKQIQTLKLVKGN